MSILRWMTFRNCISKAWDLVAVKHFPAEQEMEMKTQKEREVLSPKGCSNCDRAPFDTKARLESRSSLSVYTKSVSILPVNVPVSCKSLMSVGNVLCLSRIWGICYFWFFFIFDCLCWQHQNCWSPWCAANAAQWMDLHSPRPELCAGNKSPVWKCFTYWI